MATTQTSAESVPRKDESNAIIKNGNDMMSESTPNDCYSRVKSPSMSMSDSHPTHPNSQNSDTNSYANYNSNYSDDSYRNSHVPEPQVGQYPTSQHHPNYQNSSDIQTSAGQPTGPPSSQSGPHNPQMKGQPPVSAGGWPGSGPPGPPPNMNNINDQNVGPNSGPAVSAGQIQSSDAIKSKMAYMQQPAHPGQPVMGPQPGQHPGQPLPGLHGAQHHSQHPQYPQQYHSPHPQYQQTNQMYNRYHQPLGPPNAPPAMPGMGPPVRGPNSGINYNNSSNMNNSSMSNSSSMSPMTQNNSSANNVNNSSVRYPGQPVSGPTPTLNQLLQSPNTLQRYSNSYSDYSSGGPPPTGKEHSLTQQQQQQWNTMRFNQHQQQQQQLYRSQVSTLSLCYFRPYPTILCGGGRYRLPMTVDIRCD